MMTTNELARALLPYTSVQMRRVRGGGEVPELNIGSIPDPDLEEAVAEAHRKGRSQSVRAALLELHGFGS